MKNKVLAEDILSFNISEEMRDSIRSKNIIVTGATGLIGSSIVKYLLALGIDIHITALVRNLKKANDTYGNSISKIRVIESDICKYFDQTDDKQNYVIHCASPTNGDYMNNHPVETFDVATSTTKSIMKYACRSKCDAIVFLSSIEYYGFNDNDKLITEEFIGYIDVSKPRSSYPLGKRAAEFICKAYAIQYNVPVKIARLTQCFGAGVNLNDNRVFMQFAKSILKNKNIQLHTSGNSSKPYCYVSDCVKAILYILLYGDNGESYNVSTPNTYISIRELAQKLIEWFNPELELEYKILENNNYAPQSKLNIDSSKLMKLGWTPEYNLYEMFDRLILSLKQDVNNKL